MSSRLNRPIISEDSTTSFSPSLVRIAITLFLFNIQVRYTPTLQEAEKYAINATLQVKKHRCQTDTPLITQPETPRFPRVSISSWAMHQYHLRRFLSRLCLSV